MVEFLRVFWYDNLYYDYRRNSKLETEEKKLTSSEIEDMLKEVEAIHKPRRTVNRDRKKKRKIRPDRILAALIVIGVIVLIVVVVSKMIREDNKSKSAENTTAALAGSPLQDDQYPEITELVQNYLNAYLISDDEKRMNKIRECVVDLDDISDISKRDYVKNYSDVECYTKDGPYEATYIVYAYYQTTYVNISTPAPSISVFYVMRKGDTMDVYIKNKIPEDVNEYIKKVSKDSDVQQLLSDVQKEIDAARTKDEHLDKYLNSVAKKSSKTKE